MPILFLSVQHLDGYLFKLLALEIDNFTSLSCQQQIFNPYSKRKNRKREIKRKKDKKEEEVAVGY